MQNTIQYESRGGVARILLAARGAGNALDQGMLERIGQCIEQASVDDCRAIVISAEGPDFCRGMDLEATADAGRPRMELFRAAASCISALCRSPLPVIACVDGRAMGGGVGLAAACDIVLASQRASFMLSEAILGMIPALITPVLARRLSPARIRYLALSTRGLPAAEAHLIGLVDEVADGELEAALDRQLQRLFRSCPAALAECKSHAARSEPPIEMELDRAFERIARWLETSEVLEGIRAFANNRSPSWFEKYRKEQSAN